MCDENNIVGPLGWDYPILTGFLKEFDGRRFARIVDAYHGDVIIRKE